MGIDVGQFRDLVIRSTLDAIGEPQNSEAAVQLLLSTALHESGLRYLKQVPNGPALGVYQMEPATHLDICQWAFMRAKRDLWMRVHDVTRLPSSMESINHSLLVTDLCYATAIARLHYWRVPEALPEAGDAEGMWRYYKRYWNTHLGAATREQFMASWRSNEAEILA